jgi:large subunit ribosomal protein L3
VVIATMSRNAIALVALPLPPPYVLPRSILRSQPGIVQKRCFGIRSIDRPRHDKYHPNSLLASQAAAHTRKELADTLPLRTGALAIKKGMTAVFDENGQRIGCTVLQLDRNQVVSHKTRRKNGYYAVCVGSGHKHEKNITKPMLGHFSVQGVSPKRHLHEFRVRDETGLLPVGELIQANWFQPGQFVDTRSNCKGKGWQGVMKRWGMHGQDRSHGVSKTHRSMGSAGQGQGGGSRVYPGKKMAGNMGGQRNTIQNVKVLQSDPEQGILLVQGNFSGLFPKTFMLIL